MSQIDSQLHYALAHVAILMILWPSHHVIILGKLFVVIYWTDTSDLCINPDVPGSCGSVWSWMHPIEVQLTSIICLSSGMWVGHHLQLWEGVFHAGWVIARRWGPGNQQEKRTQGDSSSGSATGGELDESWITILDHYLKLNLKHQFFKHVKHVKSPC